MTGRSWTPPCCLAWLCSFSGPRLGDAVSDDLLDHHEGRSDFASGSTAQVRQNLILAVIWWTMYMHALYKSYPVENVKRAAVPAAQ